MPLHVICPGCLKRFQVGERFAGMKGPCPNCGTIIDIPKEPIAMSETERRVIPRLDLEFDPIQARYCALGVLGVLLLTFLLGCIPMYVSLRSFFGMLGLCLIVFPLVLFGYQTLRDRDEMFAFTGEELYRRAGIVAAGYVVLWIIFECFLSATQADMFVRWFYLAAFATLATLLTHPLLEMKTWDAFLHYCLFGFSVMLLRFLFGFGWFWESSGLAQHSTAPLLPGM